MASLNFTDIADVGSKDRDSGSFLVQVSGVGVTQIDVHIEQRPPRGTRTCPVWLRSKLSVAVKNMASAVNERRARATWILQARAIVRPWAPVLRPPGVPRAIACANSRRLDQGPKGRAERPPVPDWLLIVEARSLRSALRAPVETTEIFAFTTCDSPGMTGEVMS